MTLSHYEWKDYLVRGLSVKRKRNWSQSQLLQFFSWDNWWLIRKYKIGLCRICCKMILKPKIFNDNIIIQSLVIFIYLLYLYILIYTLNDEEWKTHVYLRTWKAYAWEDHPKVYFCYLPVDTDNIHKGKQICLWGVGPFTGSHRTVELIYM